MLVYEVPKDLCPHGLSFEAIVLDDLDYATGTFNAYMNMSRDFSTWFVESSMGPIIRDVPLSGGRVLGGAVHAQVATRVERRACAKIAEARVVKFEALFTTREVHTQEEIACALAWEREIWQRDREMLVAAMDRERC